MHVPGSNLQRAYATPDHLQVSALSFGTYVIEEEKEIEEEKNYFTWIVPVLPLDRPQSNSVCLNLLHLYSLPSSSHTACARVAPGPHRSPSSEGAFLAYATAERVVGLVAWPIDGDPSNSLGLIAHPGVVSGLAISYDGRRLVTSGACLPFFLFCFFHFS